MTDIMVNTIIDWVEENFDFIPMPDKNIKLKKGDFVQISYLSRYGIVQKELKDNRYLVTLTDEKGIKKYKTVICNRNQLEFLF